MAVIFGFLFSKQTSFWFFILECNNYNSNFITGLAELKFKIPVISRFTA